MRDSWTRRAWLGHCPRLGVPALLAAASPWGSSALLAQPGTNRLDAAAWKAVEAEVRRSLGRRRGGLVVATVREDLIDDRTTPSQPGRVPGKPAPPVFQTLPRNPQDKVLDASQTLWRPGSTVKPFLLARLLDAGLVRTTSEHRCQGKLRLGDRVLDCVHETQPAPMLPAEALAVSCNEFFVHYASRIPAGGFASSLLKAGFADRQPFGLQSAPASVEPAFDPDAHLLQCLGESHVITTPLAMAAAFRSLILRIKEHPDSPVSVILQEGMQGCVSYGTGSAALTPGLAIGGKTGTGNARDRSHLNGWFVSYAPADVPQYVMVAFVENGSGGGEAAPLAANAWKVLGDHRAFG